MTLRFSSRRGLAALVACISVLMSACANISGLGGSSEYSCKAPPGVQCDSVSGNYYNAIQNNLPSQRNRGQIDSARTRAAPGPRPDSVKGTVDASLVTLGPLPLRSQARVLRLWFKPWEDADHDLYDQGFVYVQIDNGRWLIDHAQQRIRDAYAPIHPPRAAASASAPRPSTTPAARTDTGFFSAGPPENSSRPLTDSVQPWPRPVDLPADGGQ